MRFLRLTFFNLLIFLCILANCLLNFSGWLMAIGFAFSTLIMIVISVYTQYKQIMREENINSKPKASRFSAVATVLSTFSLASYILIGTICLLMFVSLSPIALPLIAAQFSNFSGQIIFKTGMVSLIFILGRFFTGLLVNSVITIYFYYERKNMPLFANNAANANKTATNNLIAPNNSLILPTKANNPNNMSNKSFYSRFYRIFLSAFKSILVGNIPEFMNFRSSANSQFMLFLSTLWLILTMVALSFNFFHAPMLSWEFSLIIGFALWALITISTCIFPAYFSENKQSHYVAILLIALSCLVIFAGLIHLLSLFKIHFTFWPVPAIVGIILSGTLFVLWIDNRYFCNTVSNTSLTDSAYSILSNQEKSKTEQRYLEPSIFADNYKDNNVPTMAIGKKPVRESISASIIPSLSIIDEIENDEIIWSNTL